MEFVFVLQFVVFCVLTVV